MVNTFLPVVVTSPADFRTGARKLDTARLGKQRVEAYQILNLIMDLRWLGNHFKDPIPCDPTDDYLWIRRLARIYKSQSYRLVVRILEDRVQLIQISMATAVQARAILKTTAGRSKVSVPIETPELSFLPNDRIITLGFCYHPAVQMWLRYEEALADYINAHIEVFVERGYTNNMTLYQVPDKYPMPTWVSDPDLAQNHRASLLNKERTRKETPWYIHQPDCLDAGQFIDYIWPITR